MSTEIEMEKADSVGYREGYRAREAQRWARSEQLRQQRLMQIGEHWPELFAAFPTLMRAYLFGSILKPGHFRPDSDIDVAVEGLAPESFSPLWDALEGSLPEHVIDLCTLKPETFFGQQVKEQGLVLYERGD